MKKRVISLLICCMAALTACSKADTAVESSPAIDAPTTSVTKQSVNQTQTTADPVTESATETKFPDNFTEIPENAAYKQISYYNSCDGYHSVIIRFFDSHDNEILVVSENSSNNQSKNKIDYEYNDNGMVAARRSMGMNGKYVEILYEYNSDGTLAKETTYTNGKFYGYAVYTYDGHKEPIRKEYACSDEEFDGITEYTYEYDEQGRVIRKIISSDVPVYYAEDSYTYDHKGNLAATISGSTKITYSYDEDNRLIMEHHFLLDSWQASTKYVYEFY